MNQVTENKWKDSRIQVQEFIDRLKYAICSGNVKISFQKDRKVDEGRNLKYTNRYTIGHLFPDEDEIEVLKRELSFLSVEDYIETVKDNRFPKLTEMRVFGRRYFECDVYIKIRLELLGVSKALGDSYILVMSFHYSEWDFKESDFPYKKV